MKISFQNPTQGPLITVSFDDEVTAVARAFSIIGAGRVTTAANNGLATLRSAAQFAEAAPGAGGGAGLVTITGPALLVGAIFSAGDSSPHPRMPEIQESIAILPDDPRCLMNPYDMSFGCLMTRLRTLTSMPSKGITPDPRQIHASASAETARANNDATIYDIADLSTATTATTQLLETLGYRQLEARGIIEVLQSELAEIGQRLTFATTSVWLREKLEARRDQIQLELADAAFSDALVIAPRETPATASDMTTAELKWPAPVPIAGAFPADHDPKQVPQDVLNIYIRYAREHEHAAVMLLWNSKDNRYELERGWPMLPTFNTSKHLVRTTLPAVDPNQWIKWEGLGLTWYFVPSRDHLKIHEQSDLVSSGPIIIDTLMRDATGEAFVMIALTPLHAGSAQSTDPEWRSYIMNFHQTSPNGNKTHLQFLVAYEQNSPFGNRKLLTRLSDVLTTQNTGKSISGFVTPGVDGRLGTEGRVHIHLQRDDATQTIQLKFHSNIMPPTFNYKETVGWKNQNVAMLMLVEEGDQRIIYHFGSQDLIDIYQKAPEGAQRLGEEFHVIHEKTTGKPAIVRMVDGQFKSITIDEHTEWYDLPTNRFTIPIILPDHQP